MPEITSPRLSDFVETDPVTARVHDARAGLSALLQEAEDARKQRAEASLKEGTTQVGSAVCAWNHFENIPTFYNWNNRPR
ncbi:MAG TPA: multiple cyclophane-containing RiPP AmcA [Actinoplanes sp.]|jgi:hypothetical protein|nr:multiple cyclophane-containing RiPP AmcA [Actinoplanes sp.]